MPRKGYSAEEKENALRLCDDIGVKKASEETGILVTTLYNWRRTKSESKTVVASKAKTPATTSAASKRRGRPSRKQVKAEDFVITERQGDDELTRLQIENDALNAQLKTLQKALRAFTE